MDQADWKTKTSGNYTITNNTVQLTFKNGEESKKYKLAANGNLESMVGIKHTLHKVKKVAALPAAVYEKRTASTSGGMLALFLRTTYPNLTGDTWRMP